MTGSMACRAFARSPPGYARAANINLLKQKLLNEVLFFSQTLSLIAWFVSGDFILGLILNCLASLSLAAMVSKLPSSRCLLCVFSTLLFGCLQSARRLLLLLAQTVCNIQLTSFCCLDIAVVVALFCCRQFRLKHHTRANARVRGELWYVGNDSVCG
jgi:hypothetical protein